MAHDCTLSACQCTNSKCFLSARGNIRNSNVDFYNKTTCWLRRGCFNKYMSVAKPVLLYMSMVKSNLSAYEKNEHGEMGNGPLNQLLNLIIKLFIYN